MEQVSLREIRSALDTQELYYLEHHLHYRFIEPDKSFDLDVSGMTEVQLSKAKAWYERTALMMTDWQIGSMAWYIQEIAAAAMDKENA